MLTRALILAALSAGAFSAVLPRGSGAKHTPSAVSQTLAKPFPYEFPQLNSAPGALFPMPRCGPVELAEATIDQLQAAMAAGTLTSVQLAACYLQRISQTDAYIEWARHRTPPATQR